MSLTNAISAIAVVASIVIVGEQKTLLGDGTLTAFRTGVIAIEVILRSSRWTRSTATCRRPTWCSWWAPTTW